MNVPRFISGVAHPMLIPLYSTFVIFNSGTYLDYAPPQLIRVIYLVVAISTVFLPLSMLPLLKAQNIISVYSIENRRERFIPLLFSALFYFLGYYLLLKFPVTRIVAQVQLAAVFSIGIIALLSLRWKVSIHMAGIGGFLGMVLAFSIKFSGSLRMAFVAGILLAGFLGYSRLKLNLHTPSQVYAGFGIGFITIFTSLLFT